MRILHCSDLHIGKTLCDHDLLPDQSIALKRIAEIAREERAAAVVVAGDVFDRSVPSPEAVRLFGAFLADLRSGAEPPEIVIIPGNHDSAARVGYCSEVLAPAGVHVRADPERSGEPVIVERGGERCAIWAIPFLAPGAFDAHDPAPVAAEPTTETAAGVAVPAKTAADKARSDGQADLFTELVRNTAPEKPRTETEPIKPRIRGQAELFAEAVAMTKPGADPKTIDVLVCHVFASGAFASESERRFLGSAEAVDPALFDPFDYAALGHLHARQEAGAKGRYAGTPLAYAFSEADRVKSVSVVDVTKGSFAERAVPIRPPRALRRIRGHFAELVDGAADATLAEAYVEATLTDPAPVLGAAEGLRRVYPFLLSVKQECMEAVTTTVEAATRPAEEAWDILDDFRAFHKAIYGDDPDADALALFDALRGEAEHATA